MERKYKIAAIAVLAVIVIAVIIFFVLRARKSDVAWSEWVEQEPKARECGRGTQIFKRTCTVKSVVQGTVDMCKKTLGGEDTKKVAYAWGNPCPIRGQYVVVKRAQPSINTSQYAIEISEIKVIDKDGKNLIEPGKATVVLSNPIPSLSSDASIALDGDLTVFTGVADVSGASITLNLGEEKDIFDVYLYGVLNPRGNVPLDLTNTYIQILDKNRKEIFVSSVAKETNFMDGRGAMRYII